MSPPDISNQVFLYIDRNSDSLMNPSRTIDSLRAMVFLISLIRGSTNGLLSRRHSVLYGNNDSSAYERRWLGFIGEILDESRGRFISETLNLGFDPVQIQPGHELFEARCKALEAALLKVVKDLDQPHLDLSRINRSEATHPSDSDATWISLAELSVEALLEGDLEVTPGDPHESGTFVRDHFPEIV